MSFHYLFGPADPSFAVQKLPQACADGNCVPFTLEQVRAADSWEAFAASLPQEFRPDFLALDLPYQSLPPWLLSAPLPVVGLVGDGALLWHGVRRLGLDLILCDAPTAEHLRREGVEHARPAILYGVERTFVEHGPLDGPRDIDLFFAGNLHPCVQSERLPWLLRLARLGQRWNVVISGAWHDEYRALLRRSRIVFNRSTRSEWNRRNGECIGAGALLLCERGNQEVPPILEDRRECVYYDDADLEALLEHYLTNDDERQAIAGAAHVRVEEFTFEAFWQRQALAIIEKEWPLIQERARLRQQAGPPTDLVPERIVGRQCSMGEAMSSGVARPESAKGVGAGQDTPFEDSGRATQRS